MDNCFCSRIKAALSHAFAVCVVLVLFSCTAIKTGASCMPELYYDHVIFTAPSAEKIYDGTPLTEQIDVTVQGLPAHFSYKAVAEGSVTYPEDNSEDNNIVTDYVIYNAYGLDVTDKFVNVELRPGTLKVSYGNGEVLGARRDEHSSESATDTDEDSTEEIEDEDTPLGAGVQDDFSFRMSIEYATYLILLIIMAVVFVVFIHDSRKS